MEGDLQQALGRNLRVHRERLGLSQEALGQEIGRHRTYIGAVERGERNLALRTVERFGDLLGVHPVDLLWDRERIVVEIDVDGTPRAVERPAAQAAADGDEAPAAPVRRRRRPAPPAD